MNSNINPIITTILKFLFTEDFETDDEFIEAFYDLIDVFNISFYVK